MNSVNIIGRLGQEPDTQSTPSGAVYCKFSIAISEKYKDTEKTHWIDITAWGRQAEVIAEYLHKGDQIGISGRLQQDRWEQQDGQKRSKLFVVLERFTFIGGKKSDGGYQGAQQQGEMPDDGDIPF